MAGARLGGNAAQKRPSAEEDAGNDRWCPATGWTAQHGGWGVSFCLILSTPFAIEQSAWQRPQAVAEQCSADPPGSDCVDPTVLSSGCRPTVCCSREDGQPSSSSRFPQNRHQDRRMRCPQDETLSRLDRFREKCNGWSATPADCGIMIGCRPQPGRADATGKKLSPSQGGQIRNK